MARLLLAAAAFALGYAVGGADTLRRIRRKYPLAYAVLDQRIEAEKDLQPIPAHVRADDRLGPPPF